MSTAREAILESFLGGDPRLVEGLYLCHCQVPIDEIGHLYDVLNRRRSTIIEEDMNT
jgi:ribosome assembly protein 1